MSDPKQKRGIAQSEARDKTAKIILGFVPGGTAAYELLTTLVVPLHETKKREFINDLAIRLKRLEKQGQIDFEELAQNEEFNTIITKAILLAQQNHQKEKLEALRNFVVHSAEKLPKEVVEFDTLDYFMSIIERVSLLHLHLLKLFQGKTIIDNYRNSVARETKFDSVPTLKTILFYSYPHLKEKSEMIAVCWKDLINFSLVESIPLDDVLVPGRSDRTLVTKLGDEFLEMIEYE